MVHATEVWQVGGDAHMFDGTPCSARHQAADCSHTTIPQAEPCCCGKYLFPTFELESMDWSFEPITDDDGVHEMDKCLSGVGEDWDDRK